MLIICALIELVLDEENSFDEYDLLGQLFSVDAKEICQLENDEKCFLCRFSSVPKEKVHSIRTKPVEETMNEGRRFVFVEAALDKSFVVCF